MTLVIAESPRRALRTAALGGLAFDLLYIGHRVLQGLGPDDSTPAGITTFNTSHRATLLASEIAAGLALLAAIVFVAALAPVIRQAGQETLAAAVMISGAAFSAVGFMSQAAETALVDVADAGDSSAVLALNHLQGRTPIVWTSTALTAAVSLGALRTRLLPRWLSLAGLAAAGVFGLGSIFSVLERTVEGDSSLYGVGLVVVWVPLLSVYLWRASNTFAMAGRLPERG